MMTIEQVQKALEAGQYAWPGGYQKFFLMEDGEPASFAGVAANLGRIQEASPGDGWNVQAVDVNWEDSQMFCCITGERIPTSYGEDA